MRVLVIGGSGYVGTGILPYLRENHEIVVFDVKPPRVEDVGYIHGSIFDGEAIHGAMASAEGVIFLAMAPEPHGIAPPFEEQLQGNVLTVYRTLEAAVRAGRKHVVHASSLSVHDESRTYFSGEDLPMDARGVYGLAKGMGETVCRHFCAVHGLSVIALRLYAPSPPEVWRAQWDGERTPGHTTFRDTARAFDLALEMTGHTGFDAVFISGDYTGKYVNCAKARHLLGWEPLDRVESRP